MKQSLISLILGLQLLVPAMALAQDAQQAPYKPSIETHANYAKVNSQHLLRNLEVFQSSGNAQQKAVADEFLPVVKRLVTSVGGSTERQPFKPRTFEPNRQFNNRY